MGNALATAMHPVEIRSLMSDPADAWPENVPGRFYVDRSCIDCDLCRTTAPDNFRRSPLGYSYLGVQPEGPQQERDCRQALADCPVEAIGEVSGEAARPGE